MHRREALVTFIRQQIREDFEPDTGELLNFLDSVSLLQLVVFIEEHFRIILDMAEFDLENFRTVDTLVRVLDELE